MIFIRSLAFVIGSVIGLLMMLPILLGVSIFSMSWRYAIVRAWCRFVLFWLHLTCKINYHIEGIEHLQALNARSMLILCKHQSTFETFLLTVLLSRYTFVLKRELLWIPFFGWGLALLRPISIDRSKGASAFKKIVQQASLKLSEGTSVIMYPEGTRRLPGAKPQYKMGAFRLAALLKVPILPISHNAGCAWKKKQFLKTSGTIQVVIGAPIIVDQQTPAELLECVQTWIESHSATTLATYHET